MPYSNSVGATPDSLASIAAYLVNAGHSHHEDYELTPIQILGAKSVQDFISHAKEGFRRNSRKGAGPPPQNAANWIIVRMPDGTYLEHHEKAVFENATSDTAGLGGPIVGILNWHENKYTGAADLNHLSAAFTAGGKLIRDRGSHNIKHLRWRMDQVTDDLNVLRKSRGISPIVTMPEVKRDRAKERGEVDIIEVLAKLPIPPTTTEDLEPVLLSLGCEITRLNWDRDSISFKMPGKKKAKEFRILKLLADVAEKIPDSGGHHGSDGHHGDGGQKLGTPKTPDTKKEIPPPAPLAKGSTAPAQDPVVKSGAQKKIAPELELEIQ